MTMSSVYVKYNVLLHEYTMHKYIQELEIFNVPKIIAYDYERKVLITEKINNVNIYDNYGIDYDYTDIFDEIRLIITNLFRYNIEYSDISGYNFIKYDNKIWITNFKHARTITGGLNRFVSKFINGLNEWNTQYKLH